MPGMNDRFVSNGLSLACHIAIPRVPSRPARRWCSATASPLLRSTHSAPGNVSATDGPHRQRTRLRGDDVQLPGMRRERR